MQILEKIIAGVALAGAVFISVTFILLSAAYICKAHGL